MTEQEFQEEISNLEDKYQMTAKLTAAEQAEHEYLAKLELLQAENKNIVELIHTINKSLLDVVELFKTLANTIDSAKKSD